MKPGPINSDKIIDLAIEQYSNDDVEIDDDAKISATDHGYWVQAWVHVRIEDLVEREPTELPKGQVS